MPDENVMSRADVIAGVLAEHRLTVCGCRCGWQVPHNVSMIVAHEAHVAAVLAAAEPAAEQARAGALTEAEVADAYERAYLDGYEQARADALVLVRRALAGDAEHEWSGT